MITTGIITAPRPTSYLQSTLDSFSMEWDYEPNVFNDTQLKGCVDNWLLAAEALLGLGKDSEYILICEDDVEFTVGSARKIRAFLRYESIKFGAVSPYCSRPNGLEQISNDWHPARMVRPDRWYGACAMIFPYWVLEAILARRDEFLVFATDRLTNRIAHLDTAIGCILHVLGLPIITHSPTLVLHTGDVSTFPSNNTDEARRSRARQPMV